MKSTKHKKKKVQNALFIKEIIYSSGEIRIKERKEC